MSRPQQESADAGLNGIKGIRRGQVIGSTDRRGGEITERPLGPGDLAATIFKHLGIDPSEHWIDPAGRPRPLVEDGAPIRELI